MSGSTVVHWFRKGLRVHDNPSLRNAINEAENHKHYLRPIYILDPTVSDRECIGPNRWRFLLQSLNDLNDNLKRINTQLYVLRGEPVEMFPRFFKEWGVSCLTFEQDIEPYATKRDEQIEELANQCNVQVIQRVSHTMFDVHSIINKNNGSAPLTYQKFLSLIKDITVKQTVDNTTKVADSCTPPSDSNERKSPGCYEVPKLEEVDIDEAIFGECIYPGGESHALKRLQAFIEKKDWVCQFEKPKTSPNSLEASTTVLSPYLKFGCLSSRLFYHKLKEIESNRSHTHPPVSLMGQLLWREFYYTAAAATPNFDKMVGNPICMQIPWQKNEEHLSAWAQGRTGYPFVDAIMRQLKQEGWIHHLARHMVACFLTRGDLWVSWEDGQKVFEEYLLDADWALNAGNWMWLSASAFFYKYFRVYSPVAFGKKTDKNGNYIRKYVPELKKYPSEFIYEPWNAPQLLQETAGCVIGKDYPHRVVIHEEIHKTNLNKMSIAYKNNKEMKSLKRSHKLAMEKRTRRIGKEQRGQLSQLVLESLQYLRDHTSWSTRALTTFIRREPRAAALAVAAGCCNDSLGRRVSSVLKRGVKYGALHRDGPRYRFRVEPGRQGSSRTSSSNRRRHR